MDMLPKLARQIEEAQKSRNCLNKQGVNFPSRFKTLTIGTSIDEGPNFPSHKADFFSDTKLFEKLAGVGRP